MWLLYLWLASAIAASYLSDRKGYGEKAGLATGLMLSAIGPLIWLVVPAKAESKWKIVGFADCQGSEGANVSLRQHRADAVRRILPAALQSSITAPEAASPGNCITENTMAADRTMNRSAALILQESTVDMPPEEVRDSFERKEPDTEGC